MSKHALRPRSNVCQLCDFLLPQKALPRYPIRNLKPLNATRLFSATNPSFQKPQKAQKLNIKPSAKDEAPDRPASTMQHQLELSRSSLAKIQEIFQQVRTASNGFLARRSIPTEDETLEMLALCERLAILLLPEQGSAPMLGKDRKERAASALLDLDESKKTASGTPLIFQRMQNELSEISRSIIIHPPVFITPDVLGRYVNIHATLKKPEPLAEAFRLYADKPIPEENKFPIKYSKQNPDKIANAIRKATADQALQTAIDAKDMIAAMDLVEFSYSTKAFQRDKFVRYGLLPATGLAVAPVVAYTLASQLASYQTTMETGMATNVAFAGMVAYVGFTATIGVVALTTANDQMDRVTWVPGLPLRDRWIREDERAAVDKIAGAWGFKEVWRRGEEEGDEWDALREWIGLKGMILDRSELMEGME